MGPGRAVANSAGLAAGDDGAGGMLPSVWWS